MWARKQNEVIFGARAVVKGLAYVLGGGKKTVQNRSIIADKPDADVIAIDYDGTRDGVLEHLAARGDIGFDRATKDEIDRMNLPNLDAIRKQLYEVK